MKDKMQRILKFNLEGQKLNRAPEADFTDLVPGTSGYSVAEFCPSSEWNEFLKVAEFWRYGGKEPEDSRKVIDNRCVIPDSVTGLNMFFIRIVGKKGETKIPTCFCSVEQKGGGM